MERYFLGNNTAYGFFGNYEEELKDKRKAVLLKGGPGTGKSTVLKRIAKEAEARGFDYELWYCSGDPKSLDGVYIKELNEAIVDATAPHATGADLPILKDVIVDLAGSLKEEILRPFGEEIVKLIKCKKHRFMRAYQHLKVGFCHFKNQIELEKQNVNAQKIKSLALDFARSIIGENDKDDEEAHERKVFVEAICPYGESAYYDHLQGKQVVKVKGGDYAANEFLREVRELTKGGLSVLNPLDPNRIDGIVIGDVAVVRDTGFVNENMTIDLGGFERFEDEDEIVEEKNGRVIETALAVEELNRAREYHLELEKYFVAAMDFENNDILYGRILKELFEI